MKRYCGFCFDRYYPCGGANDLVIRCNELPEAIEAISGSCGGHVIDMQEGVVYELKERGDHDFPDWSYWVEARGFKEVHFI